MPRFFDELTQTLRMEIEITSCSLDCSRYGVVAMIADDSHFFLLTVAARTWQAARR